MNSEYYYYKNHKIHYTIQGSGKTIVLLHGFMESLKIWNNFSKELSKYYKVICIDLPGHGESECIGDIHTMEEMADLVNEITENLKIFEFVVIGHSMGGYVSLYYAEMFPDKLKGLGLLHSHALADNKEAKANRDKAIEFVKNNRKVFISQFIPELFAPLNVEKFQSEIKQLQEQVKNITSEAIIACMQGMKLRTDKSAVLNNIKVPVLFILGKQDSRVQLHNILPHILLPEQSDVLVINTGHMGYIEAEKETLFSVKNFAEKCNNILK